MKSIIKNSLFNGIESRRRIYKVTKRELFKLIKYGENQTVSFKALKTKPSILAKPIFAFPIADGGNRIF